MDEWNTLLDFPSIPAIIGQQFRLFDSTLGTDVCYHIPSAVISLDGYNLTVQYEGTRYVHDS